MATVLRTAAALKKVLSWGAKPPKPKPSESLAQALYPHLRRGTPPEPKPQPKSK